MTKQLALFFLLLLPAGGQPREGFLNVPGGPVWYRISGTGKGIPLVVLHGGPGGTSCGFGALEPLGAQRPVVTYDQLGTGRSGRPTAPELWSVERYVEELHALRQRLGLKRMHLMGHSWGGSLAAAYVLSKGTKGIESLILASPLLSTPDWIRDADELRRQLPVDVQETLRQHEAAGTTNSAEYRTAEREYTSRFVRRKAGTRDPQCAGAAGNQVIYEQMWGPSEFHATGSLRSFDVTSRLGELRLPVLLMVGEFDEARPETAARYQKMIPGAKLAVIPGAAHATLNDNREAALRALGEFLGQRK
ncbi:MAG: proline iminopeptidase-family hydrolase [Bryobacteraceae bacterium]|nr:proline iminopeptidase-family hydrolase [Bryobacteraceae bacterium]